MRPEPRASVVPNTAMMNRAILLKTSRDTWFTLVLCTAGLVLFEFLVIFAVDFRWKNLSPGLRNLPEWMGNAIERMAGPNTLRNLTPTGLMALGFSHPLVQMIMWTFVVTLATRVMVGEIDRGTADLLFGLPVRRSSLYLSVTLVWIVSGLILTAALVLGTTLGQRVFQKGEFEMYKLWLVCLNLYGLYIAIGGLSFLISAASSRRGRAIGCVVCFLIFSFIIDFVAEALPAIRRITFLGALNYYRPLQITATGEWPREHMAVLCGFGLACWLAGWIVLCRRDIRTG